MNYVLQITFVFGLITQSAGQCFQLAKCRCREPRMVTCKVADLTVVPRNIVPNVKILWLDLSHNNITVLANDSFVWAKTNSAESIQHLNLRSNTINSIEAGSFDPLSRLFYLDLATNNITHFPSEILSTQSRLSVLKLSRNEYLQLSPSGYNLPALTILTLRHCKLKNISSLFFQKMQNISQLDLANNLLSRLDEDLFASLPHLQYLSLSDNRLTSLTSVVSVSSSAQVALWGNPWLCDCELARDFYTFALNRDANPLLCGFTLDNTFKINSSSYITICENQDLSTTSLPVSRVDHDSSTIVPWSVVVCLVAIACVAIVVNPVRLYIARRLTKFYHFMRDLECVSSEEDDEEVALTDPHSTEMSTL